TDKQHKLRSKIKEKGREIKDRNTHFTITDIARNLKKQKPFEKYSVDTLRRYYPESYLYRGKIIK
ncbi:hypothetical protein KJ656_05640, partial [bacterium]|nr:hypothetical protein [bacterium]